MSYEEDVKKKKIQLAYNEAIQKRNLIIFIGAGAIFLAFMLLLMLKLRIEKQKKIQVELEKQTADLQVEAQKKELTLNVMNLIRKNEMILDLSNRLIRIKESMSDEKAGDEIVHLVNTMQKSTDDNVWEEFELRFKQVHNNFYDRLISKFPDLTPSELKLCALLKLNLSNKEISELSGQRAATLEMARYRLRKKLGISNSQVSLVTFLSQI
jgi:DNA-binding CsgD family transcriptional regulator